MRSNATRKQFKRLRANRTARYKTKRRAARNKRITFKNKHKHKKMLGGMFEEGDDETSKRRRIQDANDRRDERVRARAATTTTAQQPQPPFANVVSSQSSSESSRTQSTGRNSLGDNTIDLLNALCEASSQSSVSSASTVSYASTAASSNKTTSNHYDVVVYCHGSQYNPTNLCKTGDLLNILFYSPQGTCLQTNLMGQGLSKQSIKTFCKKAMNRELKAVVRYGPFPGNDQEEFVDMKLTNEANPNGPNAQANKAQAQLLYDNMGIYMRDANGAEYQQLFKELSESMRLQNQEDDHAILLSQVPIYVNNFFKNQYYFQQVAPWVHTYNFTDSMTDEFIDLYNENNASNIIDYVMNNPTLSTLSQHNKQNLIRRCVGNRLESDALIDSSTITVHALCCTVHVSPQTPQMLIANNSHATAEGFVEFVKMPYQFVNELNQNVEIQLLFASICAQLATMKNVRFIKRQPEIMITMSDLESMFDMIEENVTSKSKCSNNSSTMFADIFNFDKCQQYVEARNSIAAFDQFQPQGGIPAEISFSSQPSVSDITMSPRYSQSPMYSQPSPQYAPQSPRYSPMSPAVASPSQSQTQSQSKLSPISSILTFP